MTLTRKPFAEFAAELAAGLRAGRGDEPIAESARFKVIEVSPGAWRLQMIFDHAVEVVGDESFPTREAAVEEIVDRLVNCPGELRTMPIQ
jgi:hypothetical protein